MTLPSVRVGRLRHPARGDPLAVQLRLRALLSAADLAPAGLPSEAVLCVRRLDDPEPGGLRLDTQAVRPSKRWERAVADALERSARTAARPARGAVPATATSVLFADRAELLACLARDWLTGAAAGRWWWRGLGVVDRPSSAVAAFAESSRHVPAALGQLAATGWAIPFARALQDADAARIVSAMGVVFGLPGTRAAAERLTRQTAADRARLAELPRPDRSGPHRSRDGPARAFAPWLDSVPEAAALGEEPIRALFLGIALSIVRTPSAVRRPAFTEAIEAWVDDLAPSTAPAARQPPRTAVASPRRAERDEREQSSEHASSPLRVRPRASSPAAAVPPASLGDGATAPVASRRRPSAERRPSSPHPVPEPLDELDVGVDTGPVVIETRWGGVFYLLDLALYLGLYADFTQPDAPGIELDPWDLVTLLARALGAADDDVPDPVWSALAGLAGRAERDRPGGDFTPRDDWRVPAAWMASLPSTGDVPWRWSWAGGRLSIVHPSGFVVVDVRPAPPAGVREARRAVARYGRAIPLRRAARVRVRGRRPVDRWIARLAAYAHARLVSALGLADGDDLVRLLLRHDARIQITSASVDVQFALDDLPIAVRRAGLDRDPGWIPAARRSVAFHFA